MANLTPIHTMEVIPGDVIKMSCESMLRFAPLIAPIMHKVDVYTHFFFVPNRLVWSGWENFITQGQPPAVPPAFPTLDTLEVTASSLADYLGLPIASDITGVPISAIPFAAYQMIYNEYYRDQNLIDPIPFALIDGDNSANTAELTAMRKRAWQHDYFTAALPFAQKGDAVTIPIAGFEDVDVLYDPTGGGQGRAITPNPLAAGQHDVEALALGGQTANNLKIDDGGGNENFAYDPNGTLIADTSSLEAQSATINDLRRAFRLQEWLEKAARGGTRYIENILVNFGVKSSDARLNRPEYLGGTKAPMVISEVLQTSQSEDTPQGNMSGHGISVGSGKAFSYRAEEHGYVIGIMSVLPKTAYQQGIPRHFLKNDPLLYYWPTFAHLGEQEILNCELYYQDAGDPANLETFGYTPRYAEYKYSDSRVAGEFKTSLAYWHMGRIFSAPPALNQSFVESDPTTRIFAVEAPDVNKIYAHIYHRIKAIRKMPKYGIPSF